MEQSVVILVFCLSLVAVVSGRDEICSLPPTLNPNGIECMAYMPRWTFNSTSGHCQYYVYGGCGGSKNLFDTEDECRNACDPPVSEVYEPTVTEEAVDEGSSEWRHKKQGPGKRNRSRNIICGLPPTQNRNMECTAYNRRWTFNSTSGYCQYYVYGGCGGSENLFETEKECRNACDPSEDQNLRVTRTTTPPPTRRYNEPKSSTKNSDTWKSAPPATPKVSTDTFPMMVDTSQILWVSYPPNAKPHPSLNCMQTYIWISDSQQGRNSGRYGYFSYQCKVRLDHKTGSWYYVEKHREQ